MPNKRIEEYYWWKNLNNVGSTPFYPDSEYAERDFFEEGKGVLMSHAVELINKWNDEFNPYGYYYSLGYPNNA